MGFICLAFASVCVAPITERSEQSSSIL